MSLFRGTRIPTTRQPTAVVPASALAAALALSLLSIALAGTVPAQSSLAITQLAYRLQWSVTPSTGGKGTSGLKPVADGASATDQRGSSAGGERSGQRTLAARVADGPTDPKEAFIHAASAAARDSQVVTGVPASVAVAQAILESDWGRATIGNANNYFGIKATSGPGPAGIVWAETREFIGGAWTTVRAPFRAYHSMAESFLDHGRLLAENSRYARAFDFKDDPRAFARMIHQAGYATDPDYARKLIGLMDAYDLYRFDLRLPASPDGRPSLPRAV